VGSTARKSPECTHRVTFVYHTGKINSILSRIKLSALGIKNMRKRVKHVCKNVVISLGQSFAAMRIQYGSLLLVVRCGTLLFSWHISSPSLQVSIITLVISYKDVRSRLWVWTDEVRTFGTTATGEKAAPTCIAKWG